MHEASSPKNRVEIAYCTQCRWLLRDRADQLHAFDAVDDRVMNLEQDREASLRQALDVVQPLDDRHFPGRTTHVERARMQERHLNAELPPRRSRAGCAVTSVDRGLRMPETRTSRA